MRVKIMIGVVLFALAGCDRLLQKPKVHPGLENRVLIRQSYAQRVKYRIQADQLVDPVTGGLISGFAGLLAPVMADIQARPNAEVEIRVFGNRAFSKSRTKALHAFQADALAAYFWSKGVAPERVRVRERSAAADEPSAFLSPDRLAALRSIEIHICPRG